MYSVRLSITQSSLQVLCEKIRFMCRDALFAQKICLKSKLKLSCLHCFLALVFARVETVERGPDPLVLSLMIVNWFLNPIALFGPTFSNPDTFQEQVLIEIYDKTRVYWRMKAEVRFFLIDFVPFLKFRIGVGHCRRRHNQETT